MSVKTEAMRAYLEQIVKLGDDPDGLDDIGSLFGDLVVGADALLAQMRVNESGDLRAWVDAALKTDDIPMEAFVHGIGTDVEHDLIPLWALTVAARPRLVLELGTRHAISTRTLAHACQRVGAVLMTCDPDPGCAPFLRGVQAIAFRCTGERLYEMALFPPGSVDVLFVDVDPHGYEQTQGFLSTFVAQTLTPGGIALLHDVNARDVSGAPRPDIQVKAAIATWIRSKTIVLKDTPIRLNDPRSGIRVETEMPADWDYVELGHDGAGGLGVLRRRG